MRTGADDYNEIAKANNWASLCDASATFSHPDLRRLLGLWRKQAKGGIPLRRDMTPNLLKSFLPDIAISKHVTGEGGERRYRVCRMGSWFARILGNFTGKFLDDALAPEHLPRWHLALDTTLAERSAAFPRPHRHQYDELPERRVFRCPVARRRQLCELHPGGGPVRRRTPLGRRRSRGAPGTGAGIRQEG
jgi:hypothetical protein